MYICITHCSFAQRQPSHVPSHLHTSKININKCALNIYMYTCNQCVCTHVRA